MRTIAFMLGIATAVAACGPRQVEVRTAPTQSAEVAIHFTNNLSSAVNVYVNTGSTDMFVRQVNARTAEHLPVPGVSVGTRATLKAVPVGSQSGGYQKTGVTMSEMVSWSVP
jgi:ABC-type glycerol-3-phosphate transport system substrate-binding protein